MGKLQLHWQMLIAIVAAVLVGLWSGTDSAELVRHFWFYRHVVSQCAENDYCALSDVLDHCWDGWFG